MKINWKPKLRLRGAVPAACLIITLVTFAGCGRGQAQSAMPLKDTPFYQDYHEAHPLATPSENDVRALAFDGQETLVGGDGGRRTRSGSGTVEDSPRRGKTRPHLCAVPGREGRDLDRGVERIIPRQWGTSDAHHAPRHAHQRDLCAACRKTASRKTLFAGGPQGVWRSEGDPANRWTPVQGAWHRGIRSLLPDGDNRLWIGTSSGLYLQELSKAPLPAVRYSRPDVVLSSDISRLTPLPDGEFAIASTGGIDFYRGTRRIRFLTGQNGMPSHQARAIAQGHGWQAVGGDPNGRGPFRSRAMEPAPQPPLAHQRRYPRRRDRQRRRGVDRNGIGRGTPFAASR